MAQNGNTSSVKVDTTLINKSALSDTSTFVMKKSPWGSVLRSAILPGFGQFYNESYWKIPIVWGALGYLSYQWNQSDNSYKTFRELYSKSLLENKEGHESYYGKREQARDQRDMFAVFIGITYLLNLVDAFVDAHLFDFDVTSNSQNQFQVSLKIKL